jgi:predicted outer membrane repeat protein
LRHLLRPCVTWCPAAQRAAPAPVGPPRATYYSATSGDELWVKTGTYKPTTGSDRTATFPLKSGVGVYGGFAGTETLRAQRNWTTNITTLSGDIGASGNTSDNVYHVVTGNTTDNTAVLDGFTVTGGNANGGTNPDDQGGGMYTSNGSPTVRNVVFSSNAATIAGGAMYNNHSSPALQMVTFSDNTSTGNGGALCNADDSNATLMNVTFHANAVTGGNGGAVLNDYSSPILVNVTFDGNTVTGGDGGALYNDLSSFPSLTNVTFNGNSAIMTPGFNGGNGGALYSYGNSAPGLNDGNGDALPDYATASPPRLTNVTFSGNQAVGYDELHPAYGGAIYIIAGSVAITNTILWGNTPDQVLVNNVDHPTQIVSLPEKPPALGVLGRWIFGLGGMRRQTVTELGCLSSESGQRTHLLLGFIFLGLHRFIGNVMLKHEVHYARDFVSGRHVGHLGAVLRPLAPIKCSEGGIAASDGFGSEPKGLSGTVAGLEDSTA